LTILNNPVVLLPKKETIMNEFPTILICRNSEGAPTSYPARISCTVEQHDEVEYLEALCKHAEDNGHIVDNEIPMIINPGDPLWEVFTYLYDDNDWKVAPLITL
jgi:hypothetical protein